MLTYWELKCMSVGTVADFLEQSQKYRILLKMYININVMAIEMKIQVCEV
jgi:hypothetical protein